jgi:superfamily II DNA or RNA helicase
MARLEDLTPGACVRGILPDGLVTIVQATWHGSSVLELTYKDASGVPRCELLYRGSENDIEIVSAGLPWSFDADGSKFRLVSEALRISMAYLFDPLLAVHTSLVEPLPHQITAVYEDMLTRQPLRFLLADDPGAGKTIMAGLLIRELLARGDLHRCLICAPGSLVDQWQDEMKEKFHLSFSIITRDTVEASQSGNPFAEINLAIMRLDHVSRNEELQAKLGQTEWDLIVCDEAHKMSATFFGGEISYTKRYHLGELLSRITRHFLLLTATPHNGKEADFQLFLALLDGDRFEGRFRDGVHSVDVSDIMRRLVKEDMLKFDGKPLFPERLAYTVNYTLSSAENDLYDRVTGYVREEFNRAERLENEGRKGTVGFALTTLQRRLASSPEAIYQSIKRRRERLEKRLREVRLLKLGFSKVDFLEGLPQYKEDDLEDLDDAPDEEIENAEQNVLDRATASQTIAELELEIGTLKELESIASKVRASGQDRKWEELSKILQDNQEMFDAHGHRRKLVIFTEFRDTLNYLTDRIRTLLGHDDSIATIYGGMGREVRRKTKEAFTQDKNILILVATDAAGEGINLQRAHLMVNYDLPWNPNRLEQRFGRIHRIGQTEVCHLWNLVASETREGEVYNLLLRKLEQERSTLGGKVFDILGKLTFDNKPLRELLLEAIRYGDRPEVKARLTQVVDTAMDREHLIALIEEKALVHDSMDFSKVMKIREDMERAQARRLQPHFIASFFLEAFRMLGGTVREREPRRYEITHVPALIRNRDRLIGSGEPVLTRYERICFQKDLINIQGKPMAAFVCPGHPLLDSTIDLVLERYRDLLKQGTTLIDPEDDGERMRALLYLEHSIQSGRINESGERRVVSKRMQFVEIEPTGEVRNVGYAPYLDYRPLEQSEIELVGPAIKNEEWLRDDIEERGFRYAAENLVPEHMSEVRQRREELVAKTKAAVQERLTKEINFWDNNAFELKEQEIAGKTNARINSEKARQRANELSDRRERRMMELDRERQLSALPPVVVGGALVVPIGLIRKLGGLIETEPDLFSQEKDRIEMMAMKTVMDLEHGLGYEPVDVSREKKGYDIESRVLGTGKLRFIEVKGRAEGAETVTISKREIITGLNKPEDFILALVMVNGDKTHPYYARDIFEREPGFAEVSVNYSVKDILTRASEPA